MSKERKAPGSPKAIVTSTGTYYQLPLWDWTHPPIVALDFSIAGGDWNKLCESWLDHVAECGYPAWPDGKAFYLGDLDDLRYWIETHHK